MKILNLVYCFLFAFQLSAQDSTSSVQLVEKLQVYVDSLESEFDQIEEERRIQLQEIAEHIAKEGKAKLTFICTHNSRRSQFAEVWAAVAAYYYQLEDIETFSGGTEATAFNPRAVKALKRAGFNLKSKGAKNPTYRVYFSSEVRPKRCFSKVYKDNFNPQKDFIAIMVCSDADKACPLVDGAQARFALPYIDPKVSDGSFLEKETYDGRCRQIAREMFFLMSYTHGIIQSKKSEG